jgi:hypothetical protein
MLLVLLFKPDGLTGGRELAWPFARSRKHLDAEEVAERVGESG